MIKDLPSLHNYFREFTLPDSDGQTTLTTSPVTVSDKINAGGIEYSRYTNEFWTARQRQASRLQEISYRACFKPQLPRFFISLLTETGDTVYDPFTGRGTTPVEAALMGRKIISNDINTLSTIFTQPRLCPPDLKEVKTRLFSITDSWEECDIDLTMFYHQDTLRTILGLREYFIKRIENNKIDNLDRWIRMVATNRLTGHSPGFFSVYTLPPNQAVTAERQVMINQKRNQTPSYRDVRAIILKKSRILCVGLDKKQYVNLTKASESALFFNDDSRYTKGIPDESVNLTVTSPPFLDIVQYSTDNWLRCWFNGLDAEEIGARITMARRIEDWEDFISDVFIELYRVTKPGGFVAFEVGEIRNGIIHLDEHVIPLGVNAGFSCIAVIINCQEFTKTANIWGVNNMSGGTNTNRIVLFKKKEQ